MDNMIKQLRALLAPYDKDQVEEFLKVLFIKAQDSKTAWLTAVPALTLQGLFAKAQKWGLLIDFENVTIDKRGPNKQGVTTYSLRLDYHAMQNVVINKFPDAKFTTGVIYQGDAFEYKSTDAGVQFNYVPKNIFEKGKTAIGVFCHLPASGIADLMITLNMEDLAKMQSSSTMAYIWKNWWSEMAIKSAIKRACKRIMYLDKDLAQMVNEDNLNSNPDLLNLPEGVKEQIAQAQTRDDLATIYHEYNGKLKTPEAQAAFQTQLSEKQWELNSEAA